jgi:hypothetical protein
MKPMLEHLLDARLEFSKSWGRVGVSEDNAGVLIIWDTPKSENGSPFHKVMIPYSFKSVSLELTNQFMKLSRKQ